MSLKSRLQQMTNTLTPLERLRLFLQAQDEDRTPDPGLWAFEDEHARQVFLHYVDLVWVANNSIGGMLVMDSLRLDFVRHAISQVRVLREIAAILEEGSNRRPAKPMKSWNRRITKLSSSVIFRSLAEDWRKDGITILMAIWEGLISLQLVRKEITEELGGNDPMYRTLAEMFREVETQLRADAKLLGVKQLPLEPSKDGLVGVRTLANRALKHREMV